MEASEPKLDNPILDIVGLTHLGSEASKSNKQVSKLFSSIKFQDLHVSIQVVSFESVYEF